MEKRKRLQLSEWELWTIQRLLLDEYHRNRANIRWEKRRVRLGEPDSRVYPISKKEEHQKKIAKLLRKIHRHSPKSDTTKWFQR